MHQKNEHNNNNNNSSDISVNIKRVSNITVVTVTAMYIIVNMYE